MRGRGKQGRSPGFLEGGPGDFLMNQADIADRARRVLDISGPVPHELERAYRLTLQADDLNRTEYQWMRREMRFTSGGSQAAVAAQFGFCQLAVLQARRIAVVERVFCNFTGSGLQFGLGAAVAAGASALIAPADDRVVANSSGCGVIFGTSAAPVLPAGSIQAGTLSGNNPEFVLTGNFILCIVGLVANTPFTFGFQWRERVVGSAEV